MRSARTVKMSSDDALALVQRIYILTHVFYNTAWLVARMPHGSNCAIIGVFTADSQSSRGRVKQVNKFYVFAYTNCIVHDQRNRAQKRDFCKMCILREQCKASGLYIRAIPWGGHCVYNIKKTRKLVILQSIIT